MKPQRPSRLQEIIRQWILLVPLATSVAGSAAIMVGPEDEWIDYLPPLFFVGALVVTASMLHQRRMYYLNLGLTERLHGTNQRLDILHRLALELNKSLDVVQVAQTVLEYTVRSLSADAGAIWLRLDLLPSGSFDPIGLRNLPLNENDAATRRWCCIAASGFELPRHRTGLENWDRALESGECGGEQHVLRINTETQLTPIIATDSPLLERVFTSDSSALSVPIIWEGEIVGAFLLSNWNSQIKQEDVILLHDIALVAGPSLQNSLLFGAATARAEIDGLTGLYNHRVIHERLTQEISRVQRTRITQPKARMSVAIMDLTDFKLFNDTYGHAVGDRVLRFISECLRSTFRASDVVGRYGGDEFVAILPDTDAQGAEIICGRAVKAISAQPFEVADGSKISIRLAAGVATYPEDGDNVAELLKTADKQLYLAKGRGKLIVESHNDSSAADTLVTEPMWQSLGVLEALISAINSKDHYTRSHSEAVWKYALLTAQEMGFSREDLQATHVASLVHDVGKIVIPDSILRKPGRLSPDEVQIMQQHTVFGALIVKDIPNQEMVVGGVRHHHERWDGTGYPDGLCGKEIPLLGRLLAVPDSFIAMITERPYRTSHTTEEALVEIERASGVQFDPEIVQAFVSAVRKNQNGVTTLPVEVTDNFLDATLTVQVK
jgi:diguanylate cyclase (GGDEF)-like protein